MKLLLTQVQIDWYLQPPHNSFAITLDGVQVLAPALYDMVGDKVFEDLAKSYSLREDFNDLIDGMLKFAANITPPVADPVDCNGEKEVVEAGVQPSDEKGELTSIVSGDCNGAGKDVMRTVESYEAAGEDGAKRRKLNDVETFVEERVGADVGGKVMNGEAEHSIGNDPICTCGEVFVPAQWFLPEEPADVVAFKGLQHGLLMRVKMFSTINEFTTASDTMDSLEKIVRGLFEVLVPLGLVDAPVGYPWAHGWEDA